jgi:seryl-tRNA synthetase
MLDPKFIRENPGTVKQAMKDRFDDPSIVDRFLEVDASRRELIQKAEELKSEKNRASKEIGRIAREGGDVEAAKAGLGGMSERIKALDEEVRMVEKQYGDILDNIPNIPHESVPVGEDESANTLVKESGKRIEHGFEARDHLSIGEICGLFDLERGAKISGSGFPVLTGQGAKLERALINYMLDVHIEDHGYREIFPSLMVNSSTMRGTGQLPKFDDDLYRIKDEDLYLIPTAEVPVTNMHAGEIIPEERLPVYYTAYTACFRKEAGSYGKDTRGLIRVHQFDKVEMVKFVTPETSMEEHEKLLKDAEDIIERLGLPYRVLTLSSGDMSFAAHKCYDIELWAPGTGKWLEVSSCSVFSDFQARRAGIRYRPTGGGKPEYVHTLNASGVALPRLVIALLETYQNEDGSVTVPEPLRRYFGKDVIEPEKGAE